ncbi:hypothetical protein [Saccharothrix lopnurensis]|uniref:Uncharacterized protein n=1 Tax=Saccharothrix lopnurensis TaxID=1670621 RepID=A0ABW1PIC3_9PSEU
MLQTIARHYRKMMTWRIVTAYIVTLITMVIGARFVNISFLAQLAPSAKEALSVMWQVHAAVITIGFTGLAIAFQLLADPQLSPGPARRAVIRRIRFNQLLTVGISSDIATGLAAIWFQSHTNVLLIFLLAFVPSVLAIGITYAYSAYLFGRPHEVENLTINDLLETVRATARHLVNYNKRSRKLSEVASGLPNVVLESPGDVSLVPSTRVQLKGPAQSGIVQDVDPKKIEQISKILMATVALEEFKPGEFGPVAHLRVRPGSKISAGASVLDLYSSQEVPRKSLDQLEKMVVGAISVSDEVDDPAGLLLRALEDLQEVLMTSMQAARYPSIRRGFKHYRKIVSTVREAMEEESRNLAAYSYETDWRWLDSHVWELNDVAARVGERVAMEAIGAVYGRCVDALSSTDVGFFVSQAQNYSQIWSSLLVKAGENKNALEHLLVSLQNLTEFTVPLRAKHEQQVDRLTGVALGVWTAVLSEAYEKGEKEWASRALGFQSRLFRFGAKSTQMRSQVQQSAILVIAWLLYRKEVLGADTDADIGEIIASVRIDFSHSNSILLAAMEARRDDNYDIIRRWEMSTALPLEMRVVRAGDFVTRAGLLLLAKFPPLAPGSISREFYNYALTAAEQVESLKASFDPQWGINEEHLDTLPAILDLLIERYQRESQQRLTGAALNSDRVSSFIESLAQETQKPSSLLKIVDVDEVLVDPGNSRVWGHRLTAPKLFFVETEVHGDPHHLGQQVGRMIRASEEALALTQLLAWGTSASLSFARTVQKVSKWAAAAKQPLVVVFGSYETASMLNYDYDNSTVTVGGSTIDAAQVYVHDDIEEHIALLDQTKTPHLIRQPEQNGGLEPVEGTRISVSVIDSHAVDAEGTPMVEIEFGSLVKAVHPDIVEVEFIRIDDLPSD